MRGLRSLGALYPSLCPSLYRPAVFLLIVRRFHRLQESVRSGSQEVLPHAGETNGEMRTAQNAAPFVQPPPPPPMLLSVGKSNYTVMTLQAAVMQNVRSISEAHPREAEVWK